MNLILKFFDIKSKTILFSIVSLYVLSLFLQGYYVQREQFGILFFLISMMSITSIIIYNNIKNFTLKELVVYTSIIYGVCLFSNSSLSNDYFRFIWDGELVSKGINPYDFKPNELIQLQSFKSNSYFLELYNGMGELSARHYTCYPVVNQFYFWLSTLFSNSIFANIIVLRLIILITVSMGFIYIDKLLALLNLERSRIWLIVLNPLFIIESIQNVHFEGIMIAFLIISIYYLITKKNRIASFFLAVSIQIKLIPLIIFPFIFKQLGFKKASVIGLITFVFLFFLSIFLIDTSNYLNFISSLKLYFENFEFNSSFYYITQKITNYHFHLSVGPLLAKIAFIIILIIAFSGKKYSWIQLFKRFTIALFIYYLFASTVHPWYILVPLILSVFTKYRFVLIWSLLIFLSYSKYSDLPEYVVRLLSFVEYGTVLLFFIYEMKTDFKEPCDIESGNF